MAEYHPDPDPDPYAVDIELSLQDFVESYTLPQTVKVTEGYCEEGKEFSNGDVMRLNHVACPSIKLTCLQSRRKQLEVETHHQTTFKVIPMGKNGPYCADIKPDLLRLRGVTELVKYCPLCVKVIQRYEDPQGRTIIEVGDRLNLLRFKRVFGVKYLECKSIILNKLVNLNVRDTSGEFQELSPTRFFTLGELTSALPHERRLQLADDIQNKHAPIPGLSTDPNAVFVLEKPKLFVNMSPDYSEGSRFQIPSVVDITVSPRQETYESSSVAGIKLEKFVEDNIGQLPILGTIVEWSSTSSVLEQHFVIPGRTLVLHKQEAVGKFVARDNEDRIYAIPENYKGTVILIKSECKVCIDDIRKQTGILFRCHQTSSVDSWPGEENSVKDGDEYEVVSSQLELLIKTVGPRDEIDALQVRKVNTNGTVIKCLPLSLQGTFEELGPLHRLLNPNLEELHNHEIPYPFTVQFTKRSTEFAPEHDPIPLNENINVEFFSREPCVLASRPRQKCFFLPLRLDISMSKVKTKEDKRFSQKKSAFDTCPEVGT